MMSKFGLSSLWNKLNEPFPSHDSVSDGLKASAWIGVFVALFLFFFVPQGPVKSAWHGLAICVGFGVVTFLCATIWDFFLEHVLRVCTDQPSWTLWKWIVSCLGVICLIAAGNLLYMDWLNPEVELTFSNYLQVLRVTMMVGVFPIVFSGLIIQMRANERHRLAAASIHTHSRDKRGVMLEFQVSAEQTLSLDANQLLSVEAMQNYVALNHRHGDQIEKTLIRSTLAAMQKSINAQQQDLLLRCHRSYLVNPSAIVDVSGNAQGLQLLVDEKTKLVVPVSRAYIDTVKQTLSD